MGALEKIFNLTFCYIYFDLDTITGEEKCNQEHFDAWNTDHCASISILHIFGYL